MGKLVTLREINQEGLGSIQLSTARNTAVRCKSRRERSVLKVRESSTSVGSMVSRKQYGLFSGTLLGVYMAIPLENDVIAIS